MAEREHCQVLTTIDSAEAAEALARGVVTARLAACAQVGGPIASTYWWDGVIDSAKEWQIVFKTTIERYGQLEAYLRTHHPYQVPEILCLPVLAGSSEYLEWISAQTADG